MIVEHCVKSSFQNSCANTNGIFVSAMNSVDSSEHLAIIIMRQSTFGAASGNADKAELRVEILLHGARNDCAPLLFEVPIEG